MKPDIRVRRVVLTAAVVVLLMAASPRRARAESLLDMKTLYYEEDGDRIRVIAPSAAWQKEFENELTIRVEGIYNSISGATPTGAPPVPYSPSTSTKVRNTPVKVVNPVRPGDDDEEDDEDGDKSAVRVTKGPIRSPASKAAYHSLSGATPPTPPPPTPKPKPKPGAPVTPTPAPGASTGSNDGNIPTADFDDERTAANLDLSKRMGRHTPGLSLSYSTENDYLSRGVALRDAIDFNKKNTTLLMGIGGTFDEVKPDHMKSDDKTTVDIMLGVSQVIDPLTLLTVNATVGHVGGYLSDPYKVAEVNGVLLPEERPDDKDKQILYGSLVRAITPLNGSLEASYRFYNDSFGIQAHTVALAWYQKLGDHWMVRPLVRYYTQSEADFYDVRFTGSPSHYSSDYRISNFEAVGGGLKVIWTPNTRVSFDVSYERYEQSGLDNSTPDDLYPAANMIMVGMRLWF